MAMTLHYVGVPLIEGTLLLRWFKGKPKGPIPCLGYFYSETPPSLSREPWPRAETGLPFAPAPAQSKMGRSSFRQSEAKHDD